MANETILTRRQMRGGVLTYCESAVVASFAATGHIPMATSEKVGGGKAAGSGVGMTDATVIQCRNVVCRTPRCNNAIVTDGTTIHVYAKVVEAYAGEGGKKIRTMTGGAVFGCRQMVGRLADADHTIVAGCAAIDDTAVLEGCQGKTRRNVADRAILRCRQVAKVLAGTDDIVMTLGTITDDTRVIEDAAAERTGGVADITVFGRWHVAGCLAEGIGAVVT